MVILIAEKNLNDMKDLIIFKIVIWLSVIEMINSLPVETVVKIIAQGSIALYYGIKILINFKNKNYEKNKSDNS